MITKHLTEDEIQQYVLDRPNCDEKISEHIHTCGECLAIAAAYQLLVTGIKQQPYAAFDFDLPGVILPQLSSAKPKLLPENFIIYLIAIVGVLVSGGALYIFRNYITDLFAGIAPLSIYLIITTMVIFSVAIGTDMYRGYLKKMNALDLY